MAEAGLRDSGSSLSDMAIPEENRLRSMAVSTKGQYQDFMGSSDTLRIYKDGSLIFSSDKDRVVPLLEYIDSPDRESPPVVVFDRIMGNAAALLVVKAGAREVYSPMGSQLGVETLKKHNIKYHLGTIVPFILKAQSQDMCFMEKLSIGKSPDEFYAAIKMIIK
jgi:hypothetical protein